MKLKTIRIFISNLDIHIIRHNWYYQLVRHGSFQVSRLNIYISETKGNIIFLGTAFNTQ